MSTKVYDPSTPQGATGFLPQAGSMVGSWLGGLVGGPAGSALGGKIGGRLGGGQQEEMQSSVPNAASEDGALARRLAQLGGKYGSSGY